MRLLTVLFFIVVLPVFQAAAQNSGYTLDDDLIYRINFGSAEDVRVLLAKGANPNAVTRQGESALDVAIERNDAESEGMARALLEKGADPNAADKIGNAPVVNAIRYKQTGIVKDLLEKGADYHTRSADGATLVDYARQNGDTGSVKIIEGLITKEEAEAASLRTPDRFKQLVRDYMMNSCVYQYWSYVQASRQEPEKDEEINKKVNQIKATIFNIVNTMQKYYPTASTDALHKASGTVVNTIFKDLDSMISNRNRIENGIGKEEDAKARCTKIIETLHIDFVAPPAAPGTPASGTTSATTNAGGGASSSQPVPPPLPMSPTAVTR